MAREYLKVGVKMIYKGRERLYTPFWLPRVVASGAGPGGAPRVI